MVNVPICTRILSCDPKEHGKTKCNFRSKTQVKTSELMINLDFCMITVRYGKTMLKD